MAVHAQKLTPGVLVLRAIHVRDLTAQPTRKCNIKARRRRGTLQRRPKTHANEFEVMLVGTAWQLQASVAERQSKHIFTCCAHGLRSKPPRRFWVQRQLSVHGRRGMQPQTGRVT